jgi:exodeoxyribonuclease V alpha subunit
MQDIFERLAKSEFRSKFKLKAADIEYIRQKGLETIQNHAKDFIKKRVAPAEIINDGKQTPMRGHPVFIAQHATATCCRGCIEKWHHLPKGRPLSEEEQEKLVALIMAWIKKQYENK